jgi:hypothetical protein
MITTIDINIKDRIDQALKNLISAQPDGDRFRIALPILYPNGNGSAVEVVINGDKCFVSDLGFGLQEAEMNGAEDFYRFAAKKSVERFGVSFDGWNVFETWASLGRLESAIISVANASVQAATISIMKATEQKEKYINTELFEKIRAIFGANAVTKNQELTGRDSTWKAHNVVSLPNQKTAIFEFVSENQNSIANKFMMFSDLSKSENSYSLNSVVKNKTLLREKKAMLANVSNVIELAANKDVFCSYIKAA